MKNRLIILLFLFSVLGIKADNIKKVLLDFNVESYTPLETTNLLISENISITFNLDFAQPIIQYPDVLINKVLANDSGSWGITSSNTLTFTPNSDWALGSLISIKINSIQSINGDEFNGVQSEFEFIVDSGNDYGIEEILIPTIATRDNNGTPHNIPLKLVLPVDRVNPVPIHFYVHGGGWLGGTETDSFAQVGPQANYLAKHLGVATIGIAYRCSGSNGTFAQAMEDIESAYQWVIANAATYNLDINNSFFEGGSAGTPLASLTAQIHAEVKAFVGFNGIYNFQENIGPFALGNAYEQEIPSTAANSTFYNLRTTPPITLLMHGDADTTIDYTQSTLFAQKINDNGGQAEVIIYPGEEHAFFNAAKDEFEDTLYEFANFLKENGFAQLINNPDVDGDGVLNTADLCPETPAGATVDSDGCIVYPNAVTITRVIDGVSNADCSGAAAGGRPKMIEMYVNGTVNFTGWNIEVQTNGDVGGVWNQTILSSLGELTNTFFYIMHDAAGSNKVVFENMYPPGASLPQKIINMWLTGNDPVRITDNSGIVIDKFGDGSDVSATGDHNNPWNYADGVAKRNDGSEPNGGVFTESNWTFINWASDGSVTCTDMATDIEFGDFSTTTLSVITKNITVQLNTDGLATITTNQIDNSSTGAGGIASYSLDVTNFTCEDTGENTVNLTVIDNKGGSASTTAIVLIEDSIVPTVLTKNITVELDADGLATITTNQIDNGATDNCSIASSSLDITSFTCANIGSNTVTLTVNDANGNSNSKTATVTIADSEAPTVLTQNITVELDADGLATITTNQINNSSTDNCSIATSSLDITNFTCANIGPNTVNLTINDVNGNSSSASAIVTI
ncbi:MAG: alpha/beta hydrolase fold domain-containing protein, partial [Lutibacter sp.]|uniref:alpha/beta hydrolase n=1 Tax=Lutibacter sp. TaxID=1925666 RepID=UPI0019F615C9